MNDAPAIHALPDHDTDSPITPAVPVTRSEEDIQKLIREWVVDPCWELADTTGFELHRERLLRVSLEHEAAWQARRKRELSAKAEKLGIPGNLELTSHIEFLEGRIAKLEGQVGVLENGQ